MARWDVSPDGQRRRIFEQVFMLPDLPGCWLWTGIVNNMGYGHVRFNGRETLVHRASYEMAFGPIPSGLCVLHRCDTPTCMRPDHLFLGTRIDNNRDRDAKGRTRQGHCYGEDHHAGKLTTEAVLAIRRSTARLKVLAVRYGVTETMISLVRRRKSWTHVPDEYLKKEGKPPARAELHAIDERESRR